MKKIREKIETRKAYSEDFEKIIPVLAEAFDYDISSKEQYCQIAKKYEYLFNNNWDTEEEHIGYKLEKPSGEIVGFWACIFSIRYLNAKPRKVCNFSTWAVKKDYRHCSLDLTKALNNLKDYSFTILSPDKTSLEIFTKFYKFKRLEEKLVFIPPLPNILGSYESEFIFFSGKDSPPENLKKQHKQLFIDHSKFNAHFFLVNKENDYCFMIFKRRRIRHLAFSYLFFISDPNIFRKHISKIRYIINKRLKTIAIIGESRNFRSSLPFFCFKKTLPNPSLFKSKYLSSDEIDGLYSEYFLIKNL